MPIGALGDQQASSHEGNRRASDTSTGTFWTGAENVGCSSSCTYNLSKWRCKNFNLRSGPATHSAAVHGALAWHARWTIRETGDDVIKRNRGAPPWQCFSFSEKYMK